MRYVKRHELHSIRETPKRVTFHLQIVDQPVKDRVWYWLYHWYDMRIPVRVPGWRRLDEWARRRGGEVYIFDSDRERPTIFDWIVSWTIAQDLRCYELSQRNLTVVADVEVPEDVYRKKP